MDLQVVLTFVVVGVAAVFLGRRLVGLFRAKSGCGCGSGGKCSDTPSLGEGVKRREVITLNTDERKTDQQSES